MTVRCTYLVCFFLVNIIQSYSTELHLLRDLVVHFSSLGDVVGGDFNASVHNEDSRHVNVYKSSLLKDFAMRNHIGCPRVDFDTFGSDYTFIFTKTTLDYTLCSNSLCSYVNLYQVYEEGLFSSTSDHLPVLMTINLHAKNRMSNKSLNCLPAWHKADFVKSTYTKSMFPKNLLAC